ALIVRRGPLSAIADGGAPADGGNATACDMNRPALELATHALLDGVEIPFDVPIPVTPGQHLVVERTDSGVQQTQAVLVGEGENRVIEVIYAPRGPDLPLGGAPPPPYPPIHGGGCCGGSHDDSPQ